MDKIFRSGNRSPRTVPAVGKKHKKRQHKQYNDEFSDHEDSSGAESSSTVSSILLPWPKDFKAIENACFRFDSNCQLWLSVKSNIYNKRSTLEKVPLKIVSYNVLFGLYESENPTRENERIPAMLAYLNRLNADVVCLQEVTEKFLSVVLSESWIRDKYFLSQNDDPNCALLTPYGQLTMSRFPIAQSSIFSYAPHKRLLVVDLDLGSSIGYLRVVNAHLTSDRQEDDKIKAERGTQKRIAQLKTALNSFHDDCVTVLIGDFNFSDDTVEYGELKRLMQVYDYRDAWVELKPEQPGYTFDATTNSLTALTQKKRVGPRRLDRILIKNSRTTETILKNIDILGVEPIKADNPFSEPPFYLSDHYGLLLETDFIGASPAVSKDVAATFSVNEATSTAKEMEICENLSRDNTVVDFCKAKAVYSSSVCLVPSRLGPLYSLVQRIRNQYDPACDRWPPHINLLYPFVPDEGRNFEKASQMINACVQEWGKYNGHPLTLTLDRFGIFEHKHSSTVILYPDFDFNESNVGDERKIVLFVNDPKFHSAKESRFQKIVHIGSILDVGHPLNLLYKILKTHFPTCGDDIRNTLMPHLTIAKFDSADDARNIALALQKVWKPLVCTFSALSVMSRGMDTPFRVKHLLPWCPALPDEIEGVTSFSKRTIAELRELGKESLISTLRQANIQVVPLEFGSSAIGTDSVNSDYDICLFSHHNVDDVVAALSKSGIISPTEVADNGFLQSVAFPVFRLWHNANYSQASFYKLLRYEEATTRCIQMEIAFAQLPQSWFASDYKSVQFDILGLEHLDRSSLKSVSGVRDSQYLADVLKNHESQSALMKFLKLIKKWSNLRRVDSHALGFPPKIAWMIMCLDVFFEHSENLLNVSHDEAVNQLIFYFFHRFSQKIKWNPTEGCAVAISPEGKLISQNFYTSANTITKGSQHMCVVGLTYPCSNYCRNLTPSTLCIVLQEMKHALDIYQRNENAKDILIAADRDFFKLYQFYLSATISLNSTSADKTSPEAFSKWPENFPPNLMDLRFFTDKLRVSFKWLESKVVTLILQLEKSLNVTKHKEIVVHPFSQPFLLHANSVTLFLGFNVKLEEIKTDRMEKVIEVVTNEFNLWKREEATECRSVELKISLLNNKQEEIKNLKNFSYFQKCKIFI